MIAFAFPLLWIAFALIGPFVKRRGVKSGKKRVGICEVPLKSYDGNNPTSQFVHEVGGERLDMLLGAAVGVAFAGVLTLFGVDLVVKIAVPAIATFLTNAVLTGTEPTDTAEHGAEIMHGDASDLDGDAQAWLDRHGFSTYGEGEVYRMVRDKDRDWDTEQTLAELKRVRWLSRIILNLGRW